MDEFMAAYNERDLASLEELVTAEPIVDVVAAAYAGTATFPTITEWAKTGWEAKDRMRSSGYSAFYPTKRGFQMYLTRWSSVLEEHGIERVATTLDAISDGCSIASLEMSGIVQAKDRPCAFYEEFAAIDDVVSNEPPACSDGSGDFARVNHTAVWTGEEVLVWGGDLGGLFSSFDQVMGGLTFDPAKERWTLIPEPRTPVFRSEVGVWTGEELIVVGANDRGRVSSAAYDPEERLWRTIDFPYRTWWSEFEGIWTGSELVIWGGPQNSSHPKRRGAIYNPVTDAWRRTSPAPGGGRWWHSVVWTGTEMIVWGGVDTDTDLATGVAYDPATDAWRKIAPAPLSGRQWFPLVWTGSEMIAWGGSSFSSNRADGAAYDPLSDSWRELSPGPLSPRHHHSAIWTGAEMIVFGGYDYDRSFRDGVAYDPVTDSWRRIPRAPIGPRCCVTSLWTGESMFVFGGTDEFGHMASGDGALYNPEADRWRRVIPTMQPN